MEKVMKLKMNTITERTNESDSSEKDQTDDIEEERKQNKSQINDKKIVKSKKKLLPL